MNCSCKKKPESVFFTSGLIALGVALLTLFVGLIVFPWSASVTATVDWGYGPSLLAYIDSFKVDFVQGRSFWPNEDPLRLLVVVVTLLSFVVGLALSIVYGLRKQKKHILLAVAQFVLVVLVGYLFVMVIYGVENQCIDRRQYFIVGIALLFAVLSLLSFGSAIFVTLLDHYLLAREAAKPVEVAEPVKEAKPAAPKKEAKPAKSAAKPVAAPVVQPAVAPVVEKPVVTAPVAKPVSNIPVQGKARRRTSFQAKVKASEADIRHKYYELRDYIVSYGIHNRISIPGDTFSAHRERYVFITLSGKHLKVSYSLDPKDYANGTIPVDENKAKKFEDLPLIFKVRSDLSLRRAKALVDDVMKKKGVAKPIVEEPAKKK